MGENAFISWVRSRTTASPRVLLGPGDDAAALAWGHGSCLLTTDMLLEGSCFTLEGRPLQVPGVPAASAYRVGRKALAVNLSDIAAMAGVPVAAVVSVGLPRRGGRALAEELYRGLRDLADEFDVHVVGGDTNTWDGPLVVSVTVQGEPGPTGIVRRSGARVGDWLMVTGPLGGSIQGKHLDFQPRVREALELASLVPLHAMMDLSDGLGADLPRLCAESHVGAVIRGGDVPCTAGCTLEAALGDGEDFELLFAVAAEDGQRLVQTQPLAGIQLSVVGEVVAEGLWLEREGQREEWPRLGHEHQMD